MTDEKTNERDVMLAALERDVIAKAGEYLRCDRPARVEELSRALANVAAARRSIAITRIEDLAAPLMPAPPVAPSADELRSRVEARVLASIDSTLRRMESRGPTGWYQVQHEDRPTLRVLTETLAALRTAPPVSVSAHPVPMIGDARWRAGLMTAMSSHIVDYITNPKTPRVGVVAPKGLPSATEAALLWASTIPDAPTTSIVAIVANPIIAREFLSRVGAMNERTTVLAAGMRAVFSSGATMRIFATDREHFSLAGLDATHLVVPDAAACDAPAVFDEVLALACRTPRAFIGAVGPSSSADRLLDPDCLAGIRTLDR